VSINTDHH